MDNALIALRKTNFDWTAHIDEIWIDHAYETHELQIEARLLLTERLEDLIDTQSVGSPLGLPLLGPAGSGKTHLLGHLRRSSLAEGAYFILVDMTDVSNFWETVSLGYLRSLQRHLPNGRRQIDHWLEGMIRIYGQTVKKADHIPKQRPPGLINRADELISKVREVHRAEVQEHADVLRALILFACDDADINDLGYKWLQGLVLEDDELRLFGFRETSQAPSRIVRGLSWILSLTGPVILALDQLDAIVAEHELARCEPEESNATGEMRRSLAIIQGIASGLLDLRDVTRRTLTVVSSLETTWDILHRQSSVSMADRYSGKLLLQPGSTPEVFRDLVEKRLRLAYSAADFRPPYPTYPFTNAFFDQYRDNTPRELLKACDAHRRRCRLERRVVETESSEAVASAPKPSVGVEIGAQLEALRASAPVTEIFEDESEDLQDEILEAACDLLVLENPVPASVFVKVERDFMNTGSYDPLHVRIRLILTEQGERERHHSFRFLEKANYRAFQARLKAALTASGIDESLGFRGLTVFRRSGLPTGKVTQSLVHELKAKGGHLVEPSSEQLATLWALKQFRETFEDQEALEEWLAREKPVSNMACFQPAVRSLFSQSLEPHSKPARGKDVNDQTLPTSPTTGTAASRQAEPKPAGGLSLSGRLPIGRRLSGKETTDEVGIALEEVPYHTCVFAGSGSGKTVFLKRVIEEAVLMGIPSIVVDGANDLSRLGSPWPSRPEAFTAEDDAKSALYQQNSEVVVWTPGAPLGNPMRLDPLPDFSAASSDSEEDRAERDTLIEIAATSLADMVIKGSGATATRQNAILRSTLRHFARGGGTLRDLIAYLREPPDDVTEPFEKGEKLARDLAELLHAELETDPLVGGAGTPLDPALLFKASDPEKTRVSVVNLVGLPNYAQKRRFIDQLASTLFSWIKKNPAPPGGILGLMVIDEAKDFVPSGKNVPGKENIKRLAAQARKYGLGLLFATQEPKSIDHSIVSNCSTLLGGKMASPAAIEALQKLLADKGTSASDVGSLQRGTFYFGTSSDKPRKVKTSLCLSYHPSTPPSETEVLEIARACRPAKPPSNS